MKIKKALGVDIGNVIINNRLNDPEVNKVDEKVYATFPPSENVFDSLKILNAHDFYKKTGIKMLNVYFVRQRHEKDGVCIKLGITHFIDDRLEVLSHMIESTPNLILFQSDDSEVEEFKQFLEKVSIANNWREVVDKLV